MTRSRNRRLRLIPSHLPLIRDKLAEYERVALKEEMAAHSQYERSMEAAWNSADNLAVAQLWWTSRDMTALAEDTVQAGDFPKMDAPAQSGLIFFDGGIQTVTFTVIDDATGRKVGAAHVSALFWQCDGDGDIELMGFTDHPCGLTECDAKSFSLPVVKITSDVFNRHVGGIQWFYDLLHAVWALSAEPHICEAKPRRNLIWSIHCRRVSTPKYARSRCWCCARTCIVLAEAPMMTSGCDVSIRIVSSCAASGGIRCMVRIIR